MIKCIICGFIHTYNNHDHLFAFSHSQSLHPLTDLGISITAVTDPFAEAITVFSNPVFVQNPLFDDSAFDNPECDDPAFENPAYAYPDYSESEAEDGFDTLRTWI